MTRPGIKAQSSGPFSNTIYIYIYIYIIILSTVSIGKSYLVASGVAVPTWSTETVLSSLVGGWWGQGNRTCFHTLYDKNLRLSLHECLFFALTVSLIKAKCFLKTGVFVCVILHILPCWYTHQYTPHHPHTPLYIQHIYSQSLSKF